MKLAAEKICRFCAGYCHQIRQTLSPTSRAILDVVLLVNVGAIRQSL
jgi:hypothetical protein